MKTRSLLKDDIPILAPIQLACWQTAYRGVLSNKYLEGLNEGVFVKGLTGILTMVKKGKEGFLVILDNNNSVSGGLYYGPSRDYSPNDNIYEIYSLNIDPGKWGKGLGTHLVKSVFNDMKTREVNAINLWTIKENKRAKGFYKNLGFGESGKEKVSKRNNEEFVEVEYCLCFK